MKTICALPIIQRSVCRLLDQKLDLMLLANNLKMVKYQPILPNRNISLLVQTLYGTINELSQMCT